MRGQPLLFLGTVVLLWTAARIVHYLPADGMTAPPLSPALTGSAPAETSRSEALFPSPAKPYPQAIAARAVPGAQAAPDNGILSGTGQRMGRQRESGDTPFEIALAHNTLWMESLTTPGGPSGQSGSPLADGPLLVEQQPGPRQSVGGGVASAAAAPARSKKWSIYGWSLLRQGSRAAALAPAAQYGGSQAGLILRYALGDARGAPSVYARVAAALASADDRTLAVGIMARPWGAVPVDVAVERRFGLADGQRDRFAAMLVAGAGATLGRSQVRIDAFGQAGIVGLTDRQGFFDLQMLATRRVAMTDDLAVSVGGGIWAGGQQETRPDLGKSWVHRVDLGPRTALALPVGDSSLTLALDWRQRVDGSARPASGAAFTVSAGF